MPQMHTLEIIIIIKPLFSQNRMIIIGGAFKNISNPLKLYEITIFPTGSSAYQILSPL